MLIQVIKKCNVGDNVLLLGGRYNLSQLDATSAINSGNAISLETEVEVEKPVAKVEGIAEKKPAHRRRSRRSNRK